MASTINLEAFVAAAKKELNALEADYAETERSYRGGKGSDVEKRLNQLKGVREGISEARKAINRALKELIANDPRSTP